MLCWRKSIWVNMFKLQANAVMLKPFCISWVNILHFANPYDAEAMSWVNIVLHQAKK